MDHLHTIFQFASLANLTVHPQPKACQVGSDTRHLEGDGLQGCIAPRLIVGRIDAKVVAQHDIIVGHVQDAITTIEITGKEYYLHLFVLAVVHVIILHHTQHIIMTHLVQPVGHLGYLKRSVIALTALQTFYQILTRFTYPTGHFDEGKHILLEFLVTQQSVHGLNIYIHAFVPELVTSTR